jgi:hypothetical protein
MNTLQSLITTSVILAIVLVVGEVPLTGPIGALDALLACILWLTTKSMRRARRRSRAARLRAEQRAAEEGRRLP